MKRYFALLIILASFELSAQIADDALISSRYIFDGTARTQAMGGAFTALGSDITSASLNPAGLGLYRSNDFSISIMGNLNKTESNYLNTKTGSNHYRTLMPNIGVALTAPNLSKLSNGEGPESWTIAFGYNQIHTFNRSAFLEGINNRSSYLDMMLDQEDSLFINTNLLFNNPLTHDYIENGYGAIQEIYMSERGGIGEYFISGAANFGDKLYIGATLGIQNYYLERIFEIVETPTFEIPLVNFNKSYSLVTKGMGVNAKLGVIYAPVYWSKIGFSIHTPTAFNLTDSESTYVSGTIEYIEGTGVNVAASNPYYPEYKLNTPMRLNLGASFLIMRQGLLAIDYEFVDYSTAQFSSSNYHFNPENQDIAELFKTSHSVRIGAEYRIGIAALRAGGFYYGSPYTKETINKDNNILGYSAGIGFKSGYTYFDISFSQLIEEYNYAPYSYEMSNIDNKNTKITATLGFRF